MGGPFALLSLVVCLGTGCGDDGGAGGGASCELTPAANSEFCSANAVEATCDLVPSAKHDVCGVALNDAPDPLERSSNVLEFGGDGPPDVSCFEPANYPAPPGASEPVTVTGFAQIFSGGCNSHDLKITFFRVQEDGQLGEPIGEGVVTPEDCVDIGKSTEHDDCGTRWECPYTYEGVPTETELAVRTENGPAGQLWAPLVQYNVYVPSSEVVDGGWNHDVRALAEPDYSVIPATAIGSPIQAGHGAVAGEVHDCGDVRLTNAIADIDQPKVVTTYFTSDEDSPLPDPSAKSTSLLGLYAALDVPEGPVTVAAGGIVDGKFVTLGRHRAWVYPDTVTSVTFKGLRPYQVPAE